jgi:hypothetical protein
MALYYSPPPPFIGGRAPLEPRRGTPPEPPLPPPTSTAVVQRIITAAWVNYIPPGPYLGRGQPYQADQLTPPEPPLPPPLPRDRGLATWATWNVSPWAPYLAPYLDAQQKVILPATDLPPPSSPARLNAIVATWHVLHLKRLRRSILMSSGAAAADLPPPYSRADWGIEQSTWTNYDTWIDFATGAQAAEPPLPPPFALTWLPGILASWTEAARRPPLVGSKGTPPEPPLPPRGGLPWLPTVASAWGRTEPWQPRPRQSLEPDRPPPSAPEVWPTIVRAWDVPPTPWLERLGIPSPGVVADLPPFGLPSPLSTILRTWEAALRIQAARPVATPEPPLPPFVESPLPWVLSAWDRPERPAPRRPGLFLEPDLPPPSATDPLPGILKTWESNPSPWLARFGIPTSGVTPDLPPFGIPSALPTILRAWEAALRAQWMRPTVTAEPPLPPFGWPSPLPGILRAWDPARAVLLRPLGIPASGPVADLPPFGLPFALPSILRAWEPLLRMQSARTLWTPEPPLPPFGVSPLPTVLRAWERLVPPPSSRILWTPEPPLPPFGARPAGALILRAWESRVDLPGRAFVAATGIITPAPILLDLSWLPTTLAAWQVPWVPQLYHVVVTPSGLLGILIGLRTETAPEVPSRQTESQLEQRTTDPQRPSNTSGLATDA